MDSSPLSDEALIAQFRQTDPENNNSQLLAILFQRHQKSVVGKCHYYLKDRETACDIAQEVWIRVMTRFYQFEAEGIFTSWLFGIAHNRCCDHLKKNKRQLHQEISRKIIDRLADNLDTEEADQLTVEILEELMEKISGHDKLLLLLKYEQGWTIKAIAHSLNMSEDNVKKHLSRTRQKLQKLLAEQRAA